MIWFFVFVGMLYAVLIISLSIGFTKINEFYTLSENPTIKFSVIIPFRNEAKNLPNLLQSIQQLNYPKELVEFLFVDDDSSDDSIAVIKNSLPVIPNEEQREISNIDKEILPETEIVYKIIKNKRATNSPKKDAISTAVSIAKNNWIITTDADCFLPKNWLLVLESFIQKNDPKMVVAPVNYTIENSFLSQFQLVDFMSLQGTTVGGFGIHFPFLCNGANLAYKKDVFLKLNGFKGNDTIASGDDIFLFEKFIQNDKQSVHYLKSKAAIVTTYPVKSWTNLIHQRARWAAKTSSFKSLKVKLIGLTILLTNLLTITYLCTGSIKTMYIPFIIKISIDWLLLKPTLQFFNHKIDFVKWYIPSSVIYPFFSIYVIFNSFFFKYRWKGRSFKQ